MIKTWVVFIVSKDCPREGDDMASKILSWFLVLALGFILCTPAQADSGTIGGVGTGTIVGVIVGVVAAGGSCRES
ncbi:MAG: hypothetical protein WCB11_05705 [Terriglobales bacterium]